VTFLLVWQFRERVLGTIVSGNGEILRSPFSIFKDSYGHADGLGSVVWNGSVYVLTFGRRVALMASDGTILEPYPTFVEDFGRWDTRIFLARDGDTLFVFGESVDFPPFDAAPEPIDYEAAVRRTDLTVPRWAGASDADRSWNGRKFGRGEHGYSPAPALAAGDGHRLVVWNESKLSRDGTRWDIVGHIVGDTSALALDVVSRGPCPHAIWNGSGFFVAVGETLFRHAPSGALLERVSLGDDVRESTVAMGTAPLVVMQRQAGIPRLSVRALDH
jgi:hypothetical protein